MPFREIVEFREGEAVDRRRLCRDIDVTVTSHPFGHIEQGIDTAFVGDGRISTHNCRGFQRPPPNLRGRRPREQSFFVFPNQRQQFLQTAKTCHELGPRCQGFFCQKSTEFIFQAGRLLVSRGPMLIGPVVRSVRSVPVAQMPVQVRHVRRIGVFNHELFQLGHLLTDHGFRRLRPGAHGGLQRFRHFLQLLSVLQGVLRDFQGPYGFGKLDKPDPG